MKEKSSKNTRRKYRYVAFDTDLLYAALPPCKLTFEEVQDAISRPCTAEKPLPGVTKAWVSGVIAIAKPRTHTLTHVMFIVAASDYDSRL